VAAQLLGRKLADGKKYRQMAGRRHQLQEWLLLMRKRGRLANKMLLVMRKLSLRR